MKRLFEELGELFPPKPAPVVCKEGRVPVCVAELTRARLRFLLSTDAFRGVGYTDFINAAIAAAEANPKKFLAPLRNG